MSGAGAPALAATAFASYTGVTGVAQTFAGGGQIFGITSGTYAGQAFYSTGLILARYVALLGATGALGTPISDVTAMSGNAGDFRRRLHRPSARSDRGGRALQSANASPHRFTRHGGPRRKSLCSATGFAPGATLGFTVTSQPAFTVKSATGTFSVADIVVPASAKAAVVGIQASATGASDGIRQLHNHTGGGLASGTDPGFGQSADRAAGKYPGGADRGSFE